MKLKQTISWGLAIILLGLMAGHAASQKRAADQAFMRQKLAYAQGILEGLTLQKYELVTKNALHMRSMSQSNTFLVLHNKDYAQHLTNFQSQVDALFMAATDKNLDAATEAYVKVTRSCVDCHRYFRLEQRSARP